MEYLDDRLAPSVFTFTPQADAYVNQGAPNTNAGTSVSLYTQPTSEESYLRFAVAGVSGPVQSAKLRLYVLVGASVGPAAYTTGTSWSETGITWNNRPARTSAALAQLAAVGANTWVEFDVTAAVSGNGTYSFDLATTAGASIQMSSREGATPPQLVVTTPTVPLLTDPNQVFSVPNISKPAYLTPVTDPVFGTKVTRIAGNPGTSITASAGGTGTWSRDARHMYAKAQPWNADGSLIAMENQTDGGGTPNELFLDGNTYQVKYTLPSNLPYGGGGDERWVYRPGHPNERLVAGWPGTTLYWFDVVRNVVTRSWTLPVSVTGIGMSEGNTSQDGRFVALSDSAGHMFVVDMDPQAPLNPYPNQRIGSVYDLGADGVMQSGWDIDWVSISPSGKYVVVEYNTPAGDAERVFDVNPNTLALTPHAMPVSYPGQVGGAAKGFIYSMGHGDLALNPFDNNQDVMIGQEACGNVGTNVAGIQTVNGRGVGHIVMVRLSDNAVTSLTDPGNGTTVADETYASHVSTRDTSRPGWAYVTYWNEPPGKRFNDEVVAVKMDGSGAVERYAHYHSDFENFTGTTGPYESQDSDYDYRSEAHAVPSPDGTRIIFASNWVYQGNGGAAIQDYVIDARSPVKPPTVGTVQVDDGSGQRSMVRSLKVTFSTTVGFAGSVANAFTLTRVGGGSVGFTATASTVGGVTVVTLTGFTGAETQFGSLADGRYTLTVVSGQVSANGQQLDGNGDGTAGDNYVLTDTGAAGGLYRLYGDANGDRRVDNADFFLLRQTFLRSTGDPLYLSALDYDGGGTVDNADFFQFKLRFGSSL